MLKLLLQAQFDTEKSLRMLDEELPDPQLRALIRDEAFNDGGAMFVRELLFPRSVASYLTFHDSQSVTKLLPQDDEYPALASFIRDGHASTRAQMIEKYSDTFEVAELKTWFEESAAEARPTKLLPGIYRREHACLEIVSEKTSVLLDPVGDLGMQIKGKTPAQANQVPEAILITHYHQDHFCLPSLLGAAASATTIITPAVETINFITPAVMDEEARLCGLNARAATWWSTYTFGDIFVGILPFFGEQPTRDEPLVDPRLRNVGNCYFIRTPMVSAMILADGGTDPAGSIAEACAEARARWGRPDVVLSGTRELGSPFYLGLPDYFPAVPVDGLRRLYARFKQNKLPSVTAGPEGIAEVIRASQTSAFLPYAHGFPGVGVPVDDVGWGQGEPSEIVMLRSIERELAGQSSNVALVPWLSGQRVEIRDGRVQIS